MVSRDTGFPETKSWLRNQEVRLSRGARDRSSEWVRRPHPISRGGEDRDGAESQAQGSSVGGRADPLVDEPISSPPHPMGAEGRQLPRARPVRVCVDHLSSLGALRGPLTSPLYRSTASPVRAPTDEDPSSSHGQTRHPGPPDLLCRLWGVELGDPSGCRTLAGGSLPRRGMDCSQRAGGRSRRI